MTESNLLYSLPLRVALPPLNESFDQNINIFNIDMDKKLCKELNLSGDNGSPITTSTTTANNENTISVNSSKDIKPNNNEETDGSISVTSSEKQEWSVTLYDVDRKGNVSEEDLARLVTMLYKAAGSSITVPQEGNGTKKIKLRLSVAPDQNHTKVFIQKPINSRTNSNNKNKDQSDSSNLSSSIPNQTTTATTPTTTSSTQQQQQQPSSSVNNTQQSTDHQTTTAKQLQQSTSFSSSKKDRKHHRSSHKYPAAMHSVNANQQHQNNLANSSLISPTTATAAVTVGQNVGKENIDNRGPHSRQHLHRKRSKKRHSRTQSADNTNTYQHHSRSTERKKSVTEEVTGPIMENMDRRQYYKDLVGIENETLQNLELSEERPSYHHNITAPAALLLKGSDNATQGIDFKTQTVFLPPSSSKEKEYKSRINKMGRQVHFEGGFGQGIGYSNHAFFSGFHHQSNKHSSKSRSHKSRNRPKSCGPIVSGCGGGNDLSKEDKNGNNFLTEEQFIDGFKISDSSNKEMTAAKTLNMLLSSSPLVTGSNPAASPLSSPVAPPQLPAKNETASPHHMRRHRNREQEYNRSMKQVAEWIQRQHTYVAAAAAAATTTTTTSPTSSPLQQPSVHEHHHIHEHHHHYHFYHYYET